MDQWQHCNKIIYCNTAKNLFFSFQNEQTAAVDEIFQYLNPMKIFKRSKFNKM